MKPLSSLNVRQFVFLKKKLDLIIEFSSKVDPFSSGSPTSEKLDKSIIFLSVKRLKYSR
jgi:hypothetical protein